MAEVDKVSVKFDADVNSFTRGVNKMERELDDFNRKADKTEKNVNTRFELMNRQVNKLNKTIEKTGDDVDLSDVMKQLEMARDEFDRTGIIANKTFKNLNKAIDDVDMDKMSVKTRKAFNTLTKDVTKLGNQTNALKEIEFAKRFDDQSKGAAIALKRTMTQLISLKKVESDIEKEMSEDSFKSYKKGLSDLNKQIFITHKELRETGKVSKTTMNELNASINNVDFKPLSKKASTEFDMIKRNIDTVSKSFDSINKSSNRSSVYFGRFIGKSKKGLDGLKEDFSKTISRINRIGTAFRNLGEVAWGAVTGIILSVLPAIIPIAGAATTSIMAIGAGFSTVAGGAIGLSGAFGIAGSAALLFQKQASYALKMLEDGTLSATNEVREYQNALDDLKSSWEELIAQNQAQIFHTMTNGINAAKFALGALNPFLTTTAQQVEQSSNKMYKWVTSSQNAQAAFNMLNARGPSIFQNLLNSAGYAGNGITRIFTSFGPLFSWTAQGIENLSRKFDNWANSSQVQQGIADFINYTKKNLPTLGSILGNTFIGIIELFKAFSGQTQWALGGLDNLMLRFRRWAETLDETQGFKDFIKYTRENAPIVGELIGNIVEILVQFVKAAAPVGSIVLKIVTAVTGWIAKMLETHPVLAKVIASVIAMSGAFKLLSIFFGIFFSAFGRIFQGLVMFIGFASRTGIAARLLGAAFTFMTGPIALVIGLIIAVGGALILLYKKNEWFRNMVNQTWSYIKALAIVTFTAIKVFLINTWNSILAVSRTVWSAIKFAIQNPIQALKLILLAIWQSVKVVTLTLWQSIRTGVMTIINGWLTAFRMVMNMWRSIITSVWTFIKNLSINTWNTIKNTVLTIIRGLVTGVRTIFTSLRTFFITILNAIRTFFTTVWGAIRNVVVRLALSLYNGVRLRFNQLFIAIKSIMGNLKNWLTSIWSSIRNIIVKFVTSLLNGVRSRFNQLSASIKKIIANLKAWLSSTWNAIRINIVNIANRLWNSVRTTFNRLLNGTKNIFRNLSRFMTNAWNGIKRSVTGIAASLWNSVRRTFNNMRNGISNIIGKIKSTINSMVKSVKNGLNKLIGGVNWVADKIGMKKLPTINFHTGTTHTSRFVTNGKLNRDTLATVGDRGRGNGPGGFRHETIIPPKGKPFITPAKDTVIPLSKGTKILNGAQTHAMLNQPQFSQGTLPRFANGTAFNLLGNGKKPQKHKHGDNVVGDVMSSAGVLAGKVVEGGKAVVSNTLKEAGSIAGKGASWLKDKVGDVMEWIDKPAKLLDKVLEGFGVNLGSFGIPEKAELPFKMMQAMFKKLKEAAVNTFKSWFEEQGGDGGYIDLSKGINFGFAPSAAAAARAGYPFARPHYGLDINYKHDKVYSTLSGTANASYGWNGGFGNMVRIVSGALTAIYGHMHKLAFTGSKKVNPGTYLGISGGDPREDGQGAGSSTGLHLHYEMRKNGVPFDPTSWLKKNNGGGKSGGKKAPSAWRSTILRAARAMGVNPSNRQINGIIAQIQRESGGDAGITQSTAVRDINALTGNLAQGLLQYVPSTFRNFAVRGHTNIKSGYDQLLAFFNNSNWANDIQYGNSGWGPRGTRRREKGGIVNSLELAWLADGGFSESVISHDPANKIKSKAIWDRTGEMLGYTDDYELLKELVRLFNDNNEYTKEIRNNTSRKSENDIYMDGKKVGKVVATHVRDEIDKIDNRKRRFQ
ncbi:peptidase M23 [Staphylococcus felis]|nr:peptidoglycan DD-metalloendopeptidase family protein [Staphylococcus felis]REH87842.1 peptidase M23 [Staphylococcus felis]